MEQKGMQAGSLKISESVIIRISELAVAEVEGVEALAVGKGFFAKQNAPIKVRLLDGVVEISVSIIVKQGLKAVSVAEEIQQVVKENVQNMTGIAVSRVNVIVAGIDLNAG